MTLIVDHSEKRKPPYLVYTYDDDFTLDPEDIIKPDDIPEPSDSNPNMDGTAAIGSSVKYARADHVHPSDTGKANAVHTHAASDIVSGTLDAARIPSLDAAKIGSGTLDAARIPSLDAAKIGSGTLDAARIPELPASKITSGTLTTSCGGTGSNAYLSSGVMNKINTSANLSVANNAWKNGNSFTLDAGVYLAIAHTEWASNSTGTRMHCLSSTNPDTEGFTTPTNQASTGFQNAPNASKITTCDFLTPTESTTYYLGLYQNSGAALNCTSRRVRIIRLQ